MYVQYNANPYCKRANDCTVRAISKATGKSWDEVYLGMCIEGYLCKMMPSENLVWGNYLESIGYERSVIPNRHYTVKDFAKDHPQGTYILAISGHVVACVDGHYYDTWDSGDEIPVYFWKER